MKKLFNFLFFLGFVIILSFWWKFSGQLLLSPTTPEIILVVFGRVAGLLAVYFILIQFLVIGRVKWLEKSYGFDRLSIFHHYLGILSFSGIIIHFLFLLVGYAKINNQSFISQIINFLQTGDELIGALIATILFISVVILSITFVKNRIKYENWYYVHLLTYLAVLTAFGHQLEMGFDLKNSSLFSFYWITLYLFVFINFIIYRFLKPIHNFYKHQFYIEKIIAENDDTISIYLKGKKIEEFTYQSGQFGIFRFLDKKNWHQAHPYSFSDVPNKKYLRITVKNLGDNSGNLKNLQPNTKVIIDGPIGIFTKKNKERNDKFIFIAGGVGITPIRSLLEEFANTNKNLILLYSAKSKGQLIFYNELELLKQQNKNLTIHYFITDSDNEHGFKMIDQTSILNLVPDVKNRSVYICGPVGMMISIKKQLINLGVNKSNIYYEKFSF